MWGLVQPTSGSFGKILRQRPILEAMRVLWDHCHDSLEKLGVEFVRRRASDEIFFFFDAVLEDILDALDKAGC